MVRVQDDRVGPTLFDFFWNSINHFNTEPGIACWVKTSNIDSPLLDLEKLKTTIRNEMINVDREMDGISITLDKEWKFLSTTGEYQLLFKMENLQGEYTCGVTIASNTESMQYSIEITFNDPVTEWEAIASQPKPRMCGKCGKPIV